MQAVDLVIRGGTIVDGGGGAPFEGDVAVHGERIVAVGKVAQRGAEEIDAKGTIVTPGFVDIHTHYDGQVTWEHTLAPSSSHGVTTVVMGNCGIGFAPCRAADRAELVRLMEGVEDLPEAVLTTGLPWAWESFPDYLEFVAARRFDADVAAQLPHAALRVFAMGTRAIDREPATALDRSAMASLARDAMAAGAIGFASSRTINHRTSAGKPVYTLDADEAELAAIGEALGATGTGVMQVVSDFADLDDELAMLRRVVERSRRPLSVSLMQWHHAPAKWRQVLDWIEACNRDGLEVRGQVSGRPIGLLMGFELSFHPFVDTPTFKSLGALTPEARRSVLRRDEVRGRIVSEAPDPSAFAGAALLRSFDKMYPLGSTPDYEPAADRSIAAIAARAGAAPAEIAYDAMLEQDAQGVLMLPSVNFADGTLSAAGEMLRHPNTVYGLGDGGAHLGFLCDASLPTFMLQYWARDRTRGRRLPLEEVVRGLSAGPAAAVGLRDRGLLRPGYKADLNVIAFDGLTLAPPRVAYDLPAGGRRLSQMASGYVARIVSGIVVQRDDRPTEARPGRLVRGATPAPGQASGIRRNGGRQATWST